KDEAFLGCDCKAVRGARVTRGDVGRGTGLTDCIRCIGIDAVRACGAGMATLKRPIGLAALVETTDAATTCAATARAATFAAGGAAEILLIGGEVMGCTDGLRIAGEMKLGI